MNADFSQFPGLPTHVRRPVVLAVDSDPDNLVLLVYALNLFGYTCISTLRGEMALQLARLYKPDLILSDLVFPDLSGVDVIKCLKQHPETQSIPIIVITALIQFNQQQYLLEMGCKDFISKPYDMDHLEAKLLRYLTPVASVS